MAKRPKLKAYGAAKVGPAWQQTAGLYLAGRSFADEADTLAGELESKWGRGRLRLLVPAEWREKFDRQRLLFNHALNHGDLEAVRREAGRMVKAWLKLDALATEAGAQVLPPQVVEGVAPDGKVCRIIPANSPYVVEDGDERAGWTVTADEVARLMHALPALARIKETWPGAEVVDVRMGVGVRDPLEGLPHSTDKLDDPIDWSVGDDLPEALRG